MSERSNLDHSRNFLERVQKLGRPPKKPDTQWSVVGAPGSVAAYTADAEFENSWGNVGAPYPDMAFHLTGEGKVWLRGAVFGGSTGTTIFTLPDWARPESTERFLVATDVAGTGGTIDVNADGTVVFVG